MTQDEDGDENVNENDSLFGGGGVWLGWGGVGWGGLVSIWFVLVVCLFGLVECLNV